MPSAGTGGPETPANTGPAYGVEVLENADDPERVFDIDTETSSIAIKAPSTNTSAVYVGYDDNVTTSNGFEIGAGQALTLDLDVEQQPVWVVATTAGDEVRYISIR